MTNNVLKIDAYSDLRKPRPTRETEAKVIALPKRKTGADEIYEEMGRIQSKIDALLRLPGPTYEEQQANRQRAKDNYNFEANPSNDWTRPHRKARREKDWSEIQADRAKQLEIAEAILIKHGIKKGRKS